MSSILIALAFIVFTAASFFGSIMWSLYTLENRADRAVQDRCDITEKKTQKTGKEDMDENLTSWERTNQRMAEWDRKYCELWFSCLNRAYEPGIIVLVLPFPDSDLPDSLVENDHKENEGTQH